MDPIPPKNTPSRAPETPEWIYGLNTSQYPLHCKNCWKFPTVLVATVTHSHVPTAIDIPLVWKYRYCPWCRVEEDTYV
jgi:hypothetical protein